MGMVRSDISKPALIFFFTARVHRTKSTVKILAAKTHCKYFLKIAEVTHCFCTRNRLYQRFVQSFLAFKHSRDVTELCNVLCKGWRFLQGSGRLQYWQYSAIIKKYLQCVLAARIFTVDFVVCTLTVGKKKSGQVSIWLLKKGSAPRSQFR
jgi:hypothetical protein